MDLEALQVTLRGTAAELVRLADRTAVVLDAEPGTRTHVLIDWENVQPDEHEVRKLVPGAADTWLFHGPNQKNVASRHTSLGERATPIPIARTGKNALDFHLLFYMGYIASPAKKAARKKPATRAVVPAKTAAVKKTVERSAAKKAPVQEVAAKKAVSKPAPAAAAASPAGAGKFVPARKSFEQVLAILKKSPPASRPAKHSRLLAHSPR